MNSTLNVFSTLLRVEKDSTTCRKADVAVYFNYQRRIIGALCNESPTHVRLYIRLHDARVFTRSDSLLLLRPPTTRMLWRDFPVTIPVPHPKMDCCARNANLRSYQHPWMMTTTKQKKENHRRRRPGSPIQSLLELSISIECIGGHPKRTGIRVKLERRCRLQFCQLTIVKSSG